MLKFEAKTCQLIAGTGGEPMKRKQTTGLTIVIDTREQKPFVFDDTVSSIRETLTVGDYSIIGYEKSVAIERKSLTDLYQSLTHERERFEREIQRLASYEFSAVVIEADWKAIAEPQRFDAFWTNRTNPKSIVGSIVALSVRYPVRWFPCPSRRYAERLTFRLLERFLNDKNKKPGDAEHRPSGTP